MGQWPFCLCVRLGFQRKSWRGVIMESFTGSKVWLDISCIMHQHWKPCWNVNYGQLKETIVICLFRFDSGFLGWDNTSQASETLYESPRGGGGGRFNFQTCEVKEEKSCFCFSKCWDFFDNSTSHLSAAPLSFTEMPVGGSLSFPKGGGGVVQFTTDAF